MALQEYEDKQIAQKEMVRKRKENHVAAKANQQQADENERRRMGELKARYMSSKRKEENRAAATARAKQQAVKNERRRVGVGGLKARAKTSKHDQKAKYETIEKRIENVEENIKKYLISIGHTNGHTNGKPYGLDAARKMQEFKKSINKNNNKLIGLDREIRNKKRNNARIQFIRIIRTYFKMWKAYLEEKEMKRTHIKNKFIRIVKTYSTLWHGVKIGDKQEHKIRKMCRSVLCIRQQNKCALCGYSMNNDITFEHIIPVSNGGRTSLFNGKALHKTCNNYIGVLPIERKTNMFVELGLELNNDYKKYEDEYDDTYDDY